MAEPEDSFTRDEYAHPRIVEELLGWISDPAGTVTTIDLIEGNRSNRFVGDVELRRDGGGSGTLYTVILLSFHTDTAKDGSSGKVETRERLLLHTVGSIGLGDRYPGSVPYDQGVLTIGADESPKKYGGRLTPQEIPIR